MVEVFGRSISEDIDVWLADELVGHVGDSFGGAVEEVWRVDPSHGEDEIDTDEDVWT